MPVWPFLWAGAGLALLLALLSRKRPLIRAAIAICAALVAVRIARMGLSEDDAKLALAAAWVSAGAFVAKQRQADTTSGLMVLSGLCYFWGRLSGAPIEFGQPPYVLADLLAGGAILFTGWGAANAVLSGRSVSLGGDIRGRGFGYHSNRDTVKAQKAERQITGRKAPPLHGIRK